MESYEDLLDMRPKEPIVTIKIDGVDAKVDYDLQNCGIISARYTERYNSDNFAWLQDGEIVEIDGHRSYFTGAAEWTKSYINLVWSKNKAVYIKLIYNGESRINALKQLQAIVTAARAAIDAIDNADNPDFEAELDAAVTEHVTGDSDADANNN